MPKSKPLRMLYSDIVLLRQLWLDITDRELNRNTVYDMLAFLEERVPQLLNEVEALKKKLGDIR